MSESVQSQLARVRAHERPANLRLFMCDCYVLIAMFAAAIVCVLREQISAIADQKEKTIAYKVSS